MTREKETRAQTDPDERPAIWIDAHHHLWDPAVRPQTWMDPDWAINRSFGPEDLREAVAGTPVEAAIVVQTASSIDETAEMMDLAADDPLVVGVVGWLDLHADVDLQLDMLASGRGARSGLVAERPHAAGTLVGVRHQAEAEPDPGWLGRDTVVASVRALGRRGLAYDLLVTAQQLPAAIELARATQDTTRLVLDHCAKPPIGADLRGWADLVRKLAGFDHVACKLSGLVTEAYWERWSLPDLAPVAEVVLECFGPQRTMFGSDWPVCLLAASYGEVAAAAEALVAGLSADERRSVFADTARHWYALQ